MTIERSVVRLFRWEWLMRRLVGSYAVAPVVAALSVLVWALWPVPPGPVGVPLIVTAVVAAGVPSVCGAVMLAKCRGWIRDGSRRCERTRRGLLVRCEDHGAQIVTLYDVAGALCLAAAAINLMLFAVRVAQRTLGL